MSTKEESPQAGPVPKKSWVARFLRIPSFPRLAAVSILAVGLGCLGTVGGLTYIKHIVPITSRSGESSDPISVWKNVGHLAFRPGEVRMNILLLGIDYNYNDKGILYTKGARSDTMMLVSLSNKAEFLNVVSVPRDTQVLISEKIGYEKINAAYSYGGIDGSMETVSQFLGVPVHHYVIVKVHGAKKVLDAIGGLPINVEKDMDYDDNWGHLHIHLKKGPQVLSGEQAVGYSRFRKDEEGDRGRMRRQQQVIRAIVDRLKSPKVAMAIPGLAQAVKDTLETDLSIAEMADLARLYASFDQKKMKAGQITGDDENVNGVAVIVPYGPENEKLVRRLLKDQETIMLSDLRIQIINASHKAGAGEKLASMLESSGLSIAKVELSPNEDFPVTEVVDRSHLNRMRNRLQNVLPQATYKDAPETNDSYDVTITIGNDAMLETIMKWSGSTSVHNAPAQSMATPAPAPARPPEHQETPTGQDDPAFRVPQPTSRRESPVPPEPAGGYIPAGQPEPQQTGPSAAPVPSVDATLPVPVP